MPRVLLGEALQQGIESDDAMCEKDVNNAPKFHMCEWIHITGCERWHVWPFSKSFEMSSLGHIPRCLNSILPLLNIISTHGRMPFLSTKTNGLFTPGSPFNENGPFIQWPDSRRSRRRRHRMAREGGSEVCWLRDPSERASIGDKEASQYLSD